MIRYQFDVLCANASTSCSKVRNAMEKMGFKPIKQVKKTPASDHYGIIELKDEKQLEIVANQLLKKFPDDVLHISVVET